MSGDLYTAVVGTGQPFAQAPDFPAFLEALRDAIVRRGAHIARRIYCANEDRVDMDYDGLTDEEKDAIDDTIALACEEAVERDGAPR